MPDLSRTRPELEEWLDRPETPLAEVCESLRDLERVNRWLFGAHATLVHALPAILGSPSDPVRVLDAACGGADLSRRLVDQARRHAKRIEVVALDLNERTLTCAREQSRGYPEITFVRADALRPPFAPGRFDLVMLATFLHHLPPERAAMALAAAGRLSRGQVVVADLVYSPLALLGIHLFARVARFGIVSAHDGPVSVRRAYTPRDLAALAQHAGLNDWRLHRHRLYRMALVYPGTGATAPERVTGDPLRGIASGGPSRPPSAQARGDAAAPVQEVSRLIGRQDAGAPRSRLAPSWECRAGQALAASVGRGTGAATASSSVELAAAPGVPTLGRHGPATRSRQSAAIGNPKVRLSVATNFDAELPAEVAPYSAVELFGKLARDVVGGGRASYMIAPVSRRRLEAHVRQAHDHGLAFDYLINPACLGNRESTAAFQRRLHRLLDWLAAMQVEWVTVSLPALLEFVKARYPRFKVRVGVFAMVDTPGRARFWEGLGADCITVLPTTVNRDFPRLRAIREAVRCDLQLLANHTCLRECPMAPYHNVTLSHASQSAGERFLVDYCLLKCSALKLAEPAHYLMSPWIRPEDVHLYEAMGYTALKILERDAPTEALVGRARAYHERRFEGNLLDLMQPYGYKEPRSKSQPRRRPLWDLRTFIHPWKAAPARVLRYREFARMRGMIYQSERPDAIRIDNRALDGFVEGLIERDCAQRDCDRCRYCHRVAREVVQIDPDYLARCLELAEGLVDDMRSGAMWGARRA